MAPTITPIDATLGATVTDIDLADLDAAAWQVVEAAFHKFAALVFPGQNLTDDAQVAFANRFGDIELLRPGFATKAISISNQTRDGSVLKPETHRYQILRGNEGWHTDSSYMPLAAKASVLSAQVVPPAGGETELADMRAAYDALDTATKQRIADLRAQHSLYHSQAKIGHIAKTGAGYGYHAMGAPVRPLVKTHPVTRRKSLFVGRHAYNVEGLNAAESETLLDDLLTFACQPPRIYRHNWQPGDVIIWDNRCVLHRARPYDYDQARVMRHTRVAGDPASELVATARDERASDFAPSASIG